MSGRRDSNPRPPAPKAGALTGLRYAPYYLEIMFYLKSDAKVLLFFIPTKPFAKNISFLTNCRAQSQVSNYDKLQFVCLIGGRVCNPRQQHVCSRAKRL